jgi:hypothetical protein
MPISWKHLKHGSIDLTLSPDKLPRVLNLYLHLRRIGDLTRTSNSNPQANVTDRIEDEDNCGHDEEIHSEMLLAERELAENRFTVNA